MRQVAFVLLVSLATGVAPSAETIVLRKNPLKLEEGIVSIHETGSEVELDGRSYPHAVRVDLLQVVREADREQVGVKDSRRTIHVAARMEDDAWEKVFGRLVAKLETLDALSFRAPWCGLEVGAADGPPDAWREMLGRVPDYFVTACFESHAGEPAVHIFASRREEDGSRRTMRGGHSPEKAREWCSTLGRVFWGEPVRELRTFPATVEERVQRVTATVLDESLSGETVELPPGALFEKQERPTGESSGSSRRGKRPADDGSQPGGPDGEPIHFEEFERRVEQREHGEELWISSAAEDAEIDLGAPGTTRILAWRLLHEVLVTHAGVMPLPDELRSDPGLGVLVAVLPDARVPAARQDAFLRDMADRIERSEKEITAPGIARAVVDSFATLGLERPYGIVCREGERSEWVATYHVDRSTARVLNAAEVCEEIERRIPFD